MTKTVLLDAVYCTPVLVPAMLDYLWYKTPLSTSQVLGALRSCIMG